MRFRSLNLAAALLLTFAARNLFAAEPSADESPPVFTYWHNWTDSQGVSHQSRCELKSFKLQSMSKPAAPEWQERQPAGSAQVIFTVQPVGWVGTWHENPKVQWIVPLKGSWFVETMDGNRVVMGPGEVSVGEDLNTKPDAQGRRGHLSGNAGQEPATLLIVQLDEQPTIDRPCRFQ